MASAHHLGRVGQCLSCSGCTAIWAGMNGQSAALCGFELHRRGGHVIPHTVTSGLAARQLGDSIEELEPVTAAGRQGDRGSADACGAIGGEGEGAPASRRYEGGFNGPTGEKR